MQMKIKRKTWIKLYREALLLKNREEANIWLEKTALNMKKRDTQGITLKGIRFLIRGNFSMLNRYFSHKEQEKIYRLFGKVIMDLAGK